MGCFSHICQNGFVRMEVASNARRPERRRFRKRAGKPITPKERPRGENVVDLMDALRRSVGGATAETKASKKPAKNTKRAASDQKEC